MFAHDHLKEHRDQAGRGREAAGLWKLEAGRCAVWIMAAMLGLPGRPGCAA